MSTLSTVSRFFVHARKYALAHKLLSVIGLALVLGGGWYGYTVLTTKATPTKYVLGTVTRGTIVSSLSESGQVSAYNQIDIKPQVSGTITWVGVTAGSVVHAGQALASIDDTTARQSVTDAENSLKTALLQYQSDAASAPISYQNAQNALATAQTNLNTTYNNTFNTLSSTYLDLPNIMTGLQDSLYGYDLDPSKNRWNSDVLLNLFTSQNTSAVNAFYTQSKADYATARAAYDTNVLAYKQITRTSDNATLEQSLADSITMATAVAQSLQTELNFLGAVTDLAQQNGIKLPTGEATIQTNVRAYLTTVNSDLSALLAQQQSITTGKQTVTTDQQNISLLQVGNDASGTNPISLQISKSSIEKQQADLQTLEDNLPKYTIVAPFDGTISAVDVKVGDNAGGSAVASIITTQQIATLSVNEVDAATIALGDKATLTFDAVPNLTLTGKVVEIDPTGTVTQGVVSYGLQIAFDTQDPRVKSGMTVNANIETAVHQDVLLVPSSAVKTQNSTSYVQVFTPELANTGGAQGVASTVAPTRVTVTTGISDDQNIEIVSGLSEGQQIVTKTIAGTATAVTTAATSAGAARGGGGGFGGAGIRIP